MIARDELIAIAADATAAAVASALPLVGRGAHAGSAIDRAAADAISFRLEQLAARVSVVVCGAEGARDGVESVRVAGARENADGELFIYCDPIDGTSSAAVGGPRSVAALALGFERRADWQGRLPDATAVFSIGSHDVDVAAMLLSGSSLRDILAALARVPDSVTGTLHRVDNLEWMLGESALAPPARHGSERHGRVSVEGDGWVAVADTTILLPLECSAEFGRMGLVEAQVQSGLYRYWGGFIVSRDLIGDGAGGRLADLDGYLRHLADDPEQAYARYFSPREHRLLADRGIAAEDVATVLSSGDFGVGRSGIVALASLRSNADPALAAKRLSLNDAVAHGDGSSALVEMVVGDADHLRDAPITRVVAA